MLKSGTENRPHPYLNFFTGWYGIPYRKLNHITAFGTGWYQIKYFLFSIKLKAGNDQHEILYNNNLILLKKY